MAVDVGGRGSTQGLRPAKKPVVKPKVTYKSAPRRTSGGSSSSRGGGSSSSSRGGGYGGGGGGGFNPPSGPKAPSINSYLGTDSVYQQGLRGNQRTLADYISELGRRKGEAGTQYTQTRGSMERDRDQQLESLRNEFASRGLIQSGLYAEEQGNFQKKFTEQMTALEQQQASLLADLLSQEKNYRRENDLANEQARQEALLRRASKYNVGG